MSKPTLDDYAADDTVGLDEPLPFKPETTTPDHPEQVWALCWPESVPHNALDVRTTLPSAAPSPQASLMKDARDCLQAVAEAFRSLQVQASLPQTASGSATSGYYSTANLPPGVSARAFSRVIREGRVPAQRVGNRKLVLVSDWTNCVAAPAKKKQTKVHAGITDDELLQTVGVRRGGKR